MRASGILMHISSLPSDYGIGTMGVEAYKFIDFLKKSKQRYWQILPVCPTSYGDSPYQSFSTYAGNPYFIDFDLLKKEGLLKKSDYSSLDWGENPEYVDYEKIYNNRYKVLEFAFYPDSDSDYLPHNFTKNSVAYIGTHDNAPLKEWLSETDKKSVEFLREYINFTGNSDSEFIWAVTKVLLSSVADTAIMQMQDILELGSEARMNIPSTPYGNWQWRMRKGAVTKELEKKLARLTKMYGR